MCKQIPQHSTPDRSDKNSLSAKETIGDLFRDYGEQYIQIYKPSKQQIKLIRAIRVCKTPALGGRVIICEKCGHKHYIYHSCGHSQCMLCQSVKREQWMDKLRSSLLKVPYMHMVFTMPHQLNSLCRMNQKVIYSMIMKASWITVESISKKQGYMPGLTSVLHTFGSDMKYHIHVHALVTYGGINKNNEWQYPDKKYGLTSYRSMCTEFKNQFIKLLKYNDNKNQLTYRLPIAEIIEEVQKFRWVVHTTKPTMNTDIIENYLARYINKVAVSKKRLEYIKENEIVKLQYNNYKNQIKGKPAPKSITHLPPLEAIHQIMQHVLPPHFQKNRSYGLHHKSSKINKTIEEKLKRNPSTIRTIFQIITTLINENPYKCEKCKSDKYKIEEVKKSPKWIYKFISIESLKSPPTNSKNANKYISDDHIARYSHAKI